MLTPDLATDVIRFGLDAVANVSQDTARAIAVGAPYSSIVDFLERNPGIGRQAVAALIAAGAFDGLHGRESRASLVAALPACLAAVTAGRQLEALGQGNPLAGFHVALSGPEWPLLTRLAAELDALGLYVSGHPVEAYETSGYLPIEAALTDPRGNGDRNPLAGLVVSINRKTSRQGWPYAVMALADQVTSVEVVWFSRSVDQLTGIAPGEVVGVTGRVSVRDDRTSIIGEKIEKLSLRGPEPMVFEVDVANFDLDAVRQERARFDGNRPVHVVLTHGDRSITIRIS